MATKKSTFFFYFLCYLTPLFVLGFSLSIGSGLDSQMGDFFSWIKVKAGYGSRMSEDECMIFENILFNIRVPRVLLAFLVGASLAVAGSILQGIFKNPLVDSYMLGISSGAAFGVSLAVVFSFSTYLFAFIFGICSVILTYAVSYAKNASIVTIVLAGMVIAGLFTAGLSVVQFLSNPYKLQAIVQWTIGNLNAASWIEVKRAYIPIICALFVSYIFRWRLNLLAMGDDAALAVGVHPLRDKVVFVVAATVMTAASVAAVGVISMFGLLVPHIVRILFGADNKKLIVASLFLGGTFLVIIDICSRAFFEFEVPVGIITILLGAPFFIYLMRVKKLNWV